MYITRMSVRRHDYRGATTTKNAVWAKQAAKDSCSRRRVESAQNII